ncbi:hypothetical protein HPB48_016800 [Haemaphysalis longicornis]|uniref:COP9 signalosome complex subunit 6 n=1 Tax=Haemaphysalis longicornis TaxID=44386 RepID=A0A9J6GSE9_HAELO|nr:hypothetical protein HPB48_016800 [Haemaphysalis longicornis]
MEVDETPANVMAASGTTGSVCVSLHPLVIMNISEHWTRIKAQEGKPQQVIGALIGKQKGRNLEVMNSFELVFNTVEGNIVIDNDYYNTKEQQFKQVFSDLDFLGWYTTGEGPTESDIQVHRQVCCINESPVLLKLNPWGRHSQLPVAMYEENVTETLFPWTSEQKATSGQECCASQGKNSCYGCTSAGPIRRNISLVRYRRVRLVLEYVKAVAAGGQPAHHEVLRDAFSLCHRLPVLRSPPSAFQAHFYSQCNDVALMTYLGTLTKGCNTVNQFVNKFNLLYDRQGMGRRMGRGLFF